MELEFFRKYYAIPRKYELQWVVIVEKHGDNDVVRELGIQVAGTHKVLDLSRRMFIEDEVQWPFRRTVYPAKLKKDDGRDAVFTFSGDDVLHVSSDRISIDHFKGRWSHELLDTFLF